MTGILFLIGSMIAIAANASTFEVADRLWHDPVTRQVVVNAADQTVADGSGNIDLASVAETTEALGELGLPVGWDTEARAIWNESQGWKIWTWGWDHLGYIAGWLVTGRLVTLGAPASPQNDPTSATAKVLAPMDPG